MDRRDIYQHVVSHLRAGTANVRGDEIGVVCPNSTCDDEGGHFSVNRKGMFNCYKCHLSGTLLPIISRNRSEWLSLLRTPHDGYCPSTGRGFPVCGTPIAEVDRGGVPRHKKGDALVMTALAAKEYCLRRGMTNEQITKYRVSVKAFDPRVYFPYWNESGELTFWMGRATRTVVEPKTIEPSDSQKPLYGRHVRTVSGLVVLVEGVFDHFVTPDSYALMGSNITGTQIAMLRLDHIKEVVLLQDPDAGAVMRDNARKLGKFGIKAHIAVLHGDRDPADHGRKVMAGVVSSLRETLAGKQLATTVHTSITKGPQ